MALPAIAAALGRIAARGTQGASPGANQEQKKPSALSPEGMTMLILSGILELLNVIIGFLDFLFGLGVLLGPVVNLAGAILIGGWLRIRFGKLPLKKALGPLVTNSIPLVKFFPWWILSVATSLDWKGSPERQAQKEA